MNELHSRTVVAQYRTAGAFMANDEHVRILRSGVEAWNEWRKANPEVVPDLSHVNLGRADLNLSGADLHRTNFSHSDLSRADLSHANLWSADLGMADLGGVNFNHADLRGANLIAAQLHSASLKSARLSTAFLSHSNLTGASLIDGDLTYVQLTNAHFFRTELKGANLNHANVGWCSFSELSLTGIKGMENVTHEGPSSIGLDTLELTAANLSQDGSDQHAIEVFLERAGVSKDYIDFFRSRIGQPIQFYSAFISYSTKDQEFAGRLYADLRQKGIRCWLATVDLKIGDKFRTRINEAIRIHDKLMVVLSEHSLKSNWVEDEVEAAFERERQDGSTVLFPIRVDDAVMESDAAWAASIRRTRHIGDFTNWKNHDEYQKALQRLIRDLQAEQANTSEPT